VDVQPAGDLPVGVDVQGDGQRAERAVLSGPRHAVRPTGIGAGVGDLDELAGTGGVQAGAVVTVVLPLVQVGGERTGGGDRGRAIPDQ
jgi:hypothetical protein